MHITPNQKRLFQRFYVYKDARHRYSTTFAHYNYPRNANKFISDEIMAKILGRKRETEELLRLYKRNEAQLVTIHGRRRVGKTYLVRETFKGIFAFHHTGLSPVELRGKSLVNEQLKAFKESLNEYGGNYENRPADWAEAFTWLKELLMSKPQNIRQVVFIDEMPWLDTPKSKFVTAFEHFWNGWASGQDNIMLIACGSASGWIQTHLIDSAGGFYGRSSSNIHLAPFTLAETEQLLKYNNVQLSRYDIAELYMAVGGIPYYLNLTTPGESVAQTIDNLFFAKKAKLDDEFNRLFNSIFTRAEASKSVIRLLATRHAGYSRDEIMKKTGLAGGREFSRLLKALEAADFIELYQPFGNNKRHLCYRLIDPFCWFWLHQVEGKMREPHFWQNHQNQPELNSWRGIAFEELCLLHAYQIKCALGVGQVASNQSSWTALGDENSKGHQIDLIIDRADRVVNMCEMKCYNDDFEVSAEYARLIRSRINKVINNVSKRASVQPTLVTTFGLKPGANSGVFAKTIALDELFV